MNVAPHHSHGQFFGGGARMRRLGGAAVVLVVVVGVGVAVAVAVADVVVVAVVVAAGGAAAEMAAAAAAAAAAVTAEAEGWPENDIAAEVTSKTAGSGGDCDDGWRAST